MDTIYLAYDSPASPGHAPESLRPIGAGSSLDELLSGGIFLVRPDQFAYIYQCRIIKSSQTKPHIQREHFIGTYSLSSQMFHSADMQSA